MPVAYRVLVLIIQSHSLYKLSYYAIEVRTNLIPNIGNSVVIVDSHMPRILSTPIIETSANGDSHSISTQ